MYQSKGELHANVKLHFFYFWDKNLVWLISASYILFLTWEQSTGTFLFKELLIKAMDDIGAVMTSFGDIVAINLVVDSYPAGIPNTRSRLCRFILQSS